MDPPSGYDRLVLYRLDEFGKNLERLEDKVDGLLIDVAMLKVKAGIWGAVAGLLPALATAIFVVVSGT